MLLPPSWRALENRIYEIACFTVCPLYLLAEMVIRGKCYMRNRWDQGLMGMKVGGKRQLFVPAHLAYGDRSMGAHIKPGADLTFEIELLEVLTRDD